MRICPTKQDVRDFIGAARRDRLTIGLVPTMGYLHEGHLALVREAARQSDKVIASLFVNPTQFGENEDLASYPRDPDRDLALLKETGVAAVFMPSVEEMYGVGGGSYVEVPSLSGILQGALRPNHFRGVSTVVTKLFNIVQPDLAVFGEKDYQQLVLIRQMVRDLDMPLEIIGHPTVREVDGLAMSSRNVRLKAADRAQAIGLNRALCAAEAAAKTAPMISDLEELVLGQLAEVTQGTVESVDIRDALSLAPLEGRLAKPAVVLLAVRFGKVLLIDQRVIAPDTVSV